MKIAVVHDYFTQLGGAEKVAEEMVRMLPGATLASLVALKHCLSDSLRDEEILTSWMQHAPGISRYYRFYFLLYPLAVGSLNLTDYDLILSSSSGYAKGVRASPDALHVCYCHSPMRWVWSTDTYLTRESIHGWMKMILPRLISVLRLWDEGASRQPDHFIANSRSVAERIRRAYDRTAEVIHPPIDVNRFQVSTHHEDYYVVLSRLVAYKRLDLAVLACSRLKRKLLVIGDGPYRPALMKLARDTVTFCGRLPDEEVNYHLSHCKALIFPGEEDFGMAPLEAAAAGRPCIAYRAGGAMETIVEDSTGVFFDEQTTESLCGAIERFETLSWNPEDLRRHAEHFGINVFRDRIIGFLDRAGVPAKSLQATRTLGRLDRLGTPRLRNMPMEWL